MGRDILINFRQKDSDMANNLTAALGNTSISF